MWKLHGHPYQNQSSITIVTNATEPSPYTIERVVWIVSLRFGLLMMVLMPKVAVLMVVLFFCVFHTCLLHPWQVSNEGLTINEAFQAAEHPFSKTYLYHQVNAAWVAIVEAAKKESQDITGQTDILTLFSTPMAKCRHRKVAAKDKRLIRPLKMMCKMALTHFYLSHHQAKN